jgi:ketosteroid isomerase-like protein
MFALRSVCPAGNDDATRLRARYGQLGSGGNAMAHKNEEAVRTLYTAFGNQDMATLRQVFAADVVWHQSGRSPVAGDHKGVDAVFAFFGKVAELSENSFTAELHDVVANDEHAVSMHTGRAQARGKALEDRNVLVVHFRNGAIAEVCEHHEDLYAVDEFWT